MKFPVMEPLRRDGKTHRPPAQVELDVERDAEEIDRLVRKGVIADVREGDDSSDDAEAQAKAKAEEEARAQAEADAKAKAEQDAKAKPATKTTKAKG